MLKSRSSERDFFGGEKQYCGGFAENFYRKIRYKNASGDGERTPAADYRGVS
jgi:hypothetical protein